MSANENVTTAPPRSEFTLGWKVLVGAAVGIACGASPVPYAALGPLTKTIAADTGWSRGEIQASALCFSAAVISLMIVYGMLIDRFGVRKIALFSTLGFGLGFASLALSPANLHIWWALWALTGAIGGASIPISWTRGVNSWFVTNRGFALSIALTGTALSGFVLQALPGYLLPQFGWRGTILIISGLPLLIGLPTAYFLFREPKAHERPAAVVANSQVEQWGMTLGEAARTRRFWLMALAFGLVAMAFGGLYTNYNPLLTDKGFDPKTAGLVAGSIAISILFGRLAAGWLIDRFWAPAIAFPMLALPAVSCWLLTFDTISVNQAVLAAVLIGFAAGAESDLIAFMAARYFGLRHYGKVYAALYMPFALMSAISPAWYGHVYATEKSYNSALWIALFLFVAGAVALLGVGRYPKVGENGRLA
jgi:OFA family oxalate/formate antiporter-like MFS transporter